jgi:hypothetical protein
MITNLLVDAVHLLKESCIFIATCVTWFSRLRILWFDTSCGWKRLVVDAKLSPEGASVNARALYQSQTGNYLYISSKKFSTTTTLNLIPFGSSRSKMISTGVEPATLACQYWNISTTL